MRILSFLSVLLLSFATVVVHGLSSSSSSTTTPPPVTRVVVFGGSGYIGRRVCRELVTAGCEVISVSRSGRPPAYYDDDSTDAVRWVAHDLLDDDATLTFPVGVDAAVSCVGDVQPKREEWVQLFGLGFDDARLRRDNGEVNERACDVASRAGARRMVLLGVSYETAKALEGPLEGYLDGKRQAESAAAHTFGVTNVVSVNPSVVYGGKRWPTFGRTYRKLVESGPARAYTGGNDALRSLSTAATEDWVERMLFSAPVEVDVVSKVVAAGALGLVTREAVGARKQGFFGLDGKPVTYDDILCVDGTLAMEEFLKTVTLPVGEVVNSGADNDTLATSTYKGSDIVVPDKEPPLEGALIGKGPLLRPLPGVAVFVVIFWALVTGRFDESNRFFLGITDQ